jgi:hypothetical protein
MANKNKTVNEDMKRELKRMEEPVDAEFEAYREYAKVGLEPLFKGQGLGEPTESDYKFSKILYERIVADLKEIRPLGQPLLISHWDKSELLNGAFKRYAQILEKNLTEDFMAKYCLTNRKVSFILGFVLACVLNEHVDRDEPIVEAMKSDDPEYKKRSRFEAFMQAHKEKLEALFKRNKLGQPTIPDYM